MVSYHMVFRDGYAGSRNRCGGLPTHLPEQWPRIGGTDLTFLFQIYCDGMWLSLPDTLCIQGYQLILDGIYCPDIVILKIPLHARENVEGLGLAYPVSPDYAGGDIDFEAVEEQEDYDLDREFDRWWDTGVSYSKLLSWCGPEPPPPGCEFLGWLADEDPFVIGAGYNVRIFLTPDGELVTDCRRPE